MPNPSTCCPHCHQTLPVPRVERLTSTLADALAQISRQTQDGAHYVKVPAYQFRGLHARLVYWGLLEELLHQKKSGSGQTRSGSWRPTVKGCQWLSGLTTVPSEVFVLKGRVVGLGCTMITFEEALTQAEAPAKGRARKAMEDEGDRLFLAEQARLERSYLEEDDDDDQDDDE